jgi:hypothetical protein
MAPKLSKVYKSNKTICDLNDDCLIEIIKKLSLKEKFRFRQNRKLRDLVESCLKVEKGLKIGRNTNDCSHVRHSTLYFEINGQNELFELNDENKKNLKIIFKMCQNIKCIELSSEIDVKLIKWIKKQCKQLECLQTNGSTINRRLTSRQWILIGDILSDKLIHLSMNSIPNPEKLTEFGLVYLLQKLTLLEELSFDVNDLSLEKISPYFGPNIKTLKLKKCYKYKLNQNIMNILKENTKKLINFEVEGYDIETLDLICRNFPQLRRLSIFFFSSWQQMDSLPQLSYLSKLEHLKVEFYQNRGTINYLALNSFPKLQSINLTGISFTPSLFEDFDKYFANIEKLILHNCSLHCGHNNDSHDKHDCNECKEKVWKFLSKLENLKLLSVNLLPRKDTGFSKSYLWQFNETSFKQIEELDFEWLPYDYETFFENLLNPLIAFAQTNTKRFFKLKVKSDFFDYVSKKRQINGVKYNVLLSNIPRNLKIINCYP